MDEVVRVNRFDWERLMLVSPLPWATRAVLLALAVYMSHDGSNARPGTENLMVVTGRGRSVIIGHLTTAVDAGYLELVERGGFRGRQRRPRASVYAATVPKAVFERGVEILESPPWKTRTSGGPDVDSPRRTSGGPDIDSGEGPDNRTFGPDAEPSERPVIPSERPVIHDQGPVLGMRTSGGPDPITYKHHVLSSSKDHHAPRAGARDVIEAEIIACDHGYPGGHIPDGRGWVRCPFERKRLGQP